MNCGIKKKGKHRQGWLQKNKSEHAQFTEINPEKPMHVTELSTLET